MNTVSEEFLNLLFEHTFFVLPLLDAFDLMTEQMWDFTNEFLTFLIIWKKFTPVTF
jgi:hypothetical protein